MDFSMQTVGLQAWPERREKNFGKRVPVTSLESKICPEI